MSTDVERFTELTEKLRELDTKKIQIETQFKEKKKALQELVKEIKDEGYDPNSLKDIIQEKEAELNKELEAFEKKLSEASDKLSQIEV